MHETIIVCPNS